LKSFIKIYGPPTLKAIRELEKIAVNTPQVCIMDTIIATDTPRFGDPDYTMNFFGQVGKITRERCNNIISKSGETLGDYDFYFEWFKEPSMDQLNGVIEKIDKSLTPLGCKYTITTKK